MSDGVAGTGRRFRSTEARFDGMEWVEADGRLLVSRDDGGETFESVVFLQEALEGKFGLYQVDAGVPSPSTEEESHPALTAAAVEGAYCCTTENCDAICCVDANAEPDAEESIDEYVARIDEGLVPAAAAQGAAAESEWPKSFRWHQNAEDVITFHNEDDMVKCAMGWEWTYGMVVGSNTGSVVSWIPIETENAAAANEADNRRTDIRDAELALHRTFYAEALAAHAESSPNRVEVLFGRACDRLRRGLRELDSARREEDVASSQTLIGPPPVAV